MQQTRRALSAPKAGDSLARSVAADLCVHWPTSQTEHALTEMSNGQGVMMVAETRAAALPNTGTPGSVLSGRSWPPVGPVGGPFGDQVGGPVGAAVEPEHRRGPVSVQWTDTGWL